MGEGDGGDQHVIGANGRCGSFQKGTDASIIIGGAIIEWQGFIRLQKPFRGDEVFLDTLALSGAVLHLSPNNGTTGYLTREVLFQRIYRPGFLFRECDPNVRIEEPALIPNCPFH